MGPQGPAGSARPGLCSGSFVAGVDSQGLIICDVPLASTLVVQDTFVGGNRSVTGSVSCPTNYLATGGGFSHDGDVAVFSRPVGTTGWEARAEENRTFALPSVQMTVYVVCLHRIVN